MKSIHGGDVYRNHVNIDFSVNVNPLGTPESIENSLYNAVRLSGQYPDMEAEKLKEAVGSMLSIKKEYLLFGNGASELFMALIHGINPQKILIPVPSFYGYEYAAGAMDGKIVYYETYESERFCLKEDFFDILTDDTGLIFIANPNNPTGALLSKEYLLRLLCHCRKKRIYVVLDECFIEFCKDAPSMIEETKKFDNLIIIRAFTKIFSVPGVRLGYMVCSNSSLLEKIKRQLPEWNLSCFAQACGCECAKHSEFIEKTKEYIKKEREFLEEGLKKLKLRVFSSKTNFILVYSREPLYEKLLEHGILIRDCESFRGLSKGFYRIAVKTRAENNILLKTIGEIVWKK